jgi:CheY-like chemotaxis protein
MVIEMIKKEKFSLALMDCEMLVLDGWEKTEKLNMIKRNKELEKLPPIMGVTAHNEKI